MPVQIPANPTQIGFINIDNRCYALATIQMLFRGSNAIFDLFGTEQPTYIDNNEPTEYEM